MDANIFLNLAIQLPIVGIFIWFILETSKRTDEQQARRDSQWMKFLDEQRAQNNEALSRLAEEIKQIAQKVAELSTMINVHDVASRARRKTQ